MTDRLIPHEDAETLMPGIPTPRSGDRTPHRPAQQDGGTDALTAGVNVDELRAVLAEKVRRSETTSESPLPLLVSDEERERRRLAAATGRRAEVRRAREAQARRRRRRRRQTLVALVVLAVLAGGIAAGVILWRKNATVVRDYTGSAGPQTIVHILPGDTRDDVAQTLVADGVVQSAQAFLNATDGDADVAAIAPGYIRVSTHLPAATAADQLVTKSNRVGEIDLRSGSTLADTRVTVSGKTTVHQGLVTQITAAACVPLNGVSHCWSADQFWKQVQTADPAALGLPSWAVASVTAATDPTRRLEGMILPGVYDVPPNESPLDTLIAVIQTSTALWNTSDVVNNAETAGITPYQAVTIASLVEREANTANMPKVAAVIENRIREHKALQLDSTVLYVYHEGSVSTTAAQRANISPYNTYQHDGLPPTPIATPGTDALQAALNPATGSWLFFVQVDKAGTFCFSVTDTEHEQCVEQARKNGVFG